MIRQSVNIIGDANRIEELLSVAIEDRLDYFDVLEKYAERRIRVYRCLVPGCGREIGAMRGPQNLLDYGARSNMGNARGAMTNHLRGHMRRGDI